MPTTDTNVPQVVVNKLTKAQYEAATKEPTEFYMVTDEQIDTSDIADGAVTATKIDFTTFVPDWTLLDSTYGLRYRKVGAMVEVDISAYSDDGLDLTSGISVDLGTLPAAYRPSRSYRFAVWGYRSSSSTSQMLSINVQSSGVVQLVYWGAGGTYQQIGGHGTFAV